MLSYPEGTRLIILSKIILRDNRKLEDQLDILQKEASRVSKLTANWSVLMSFLQPRKRRS